MNKLFFFHGITGLDDVKFVDDIQEEEFNVNQQADLFLTLMIGHMADSVFDEVCNRLGLDINNTIKVCHQSLGRSWKGQHYEE